MTAATGISPGSHQANNGLHSEATPLLSSRSSTPGQSQKSRKHHNLANYSPIRFRLTAASVWSCTFLAAFDSTVLATLTSTISSHFNASNQGSWLGTAYLLSVCCFTPIYGRLADILGRRVAHMIATVLFSLGTVGCTVAPSMRWLIVARLVAGMGGGGVQSMAVIVMTDLVDLRHRGLFQGYANIVCATFRISAHAIVFGLGNALGGPIGGYISDHFGWRTAFGIQIPLLVIGALIAFYCLTGDLGGVAARAKDTATSNIEDGRRRKLRRIDYLGSFTLVVSVATLILALSLKTSSQTTSGGEYSWSDPMIWGLLLTSAVFTLMFIYVEARISPFPVLPMTLITRRTPAAVAVSLFVTAINQFSLLYNVPLFFTAVRLDSASTAGAHLLPYSVLIGIGSLSVGWMIRRTGTYWWTCVGSGLIVLASSIMLCFWQRDSPNWMTWVAQMPGGFGYAGVLTGTLVALMTDVQIEGKGEVTGQVIGVSFSAAIVQAVLRRDLPRLITGPKAPEVIDQIRHNTDSIRHMAAEYQSAAIQAYSTALRAVFFANLGLAVVAVVGLMGIREEVMPERKVVEEDEDTTSNPSGSTDP